MALLKNMSGVYAVGATVEEVKKCIDEALALHLEENVLDYEIEYKYDVISFFNLYSKVFSMPALEKLTGINQKQLHHYATG